jgi:putative mRNA 3-end processing factor
VAIGAIWLHEEVERYCAIYRAGGIDLPAGGAEARATLKIVPPGWGARGARISTAMVSGWMRIRGTRRRRSLDRGFVLSGQADWTELQAVIDATGAETVGVLHGFRAPLARWLEEHGRQARVLETRFEETES